MKLTDIPPSALVTASLVGFGVVVINLGGIIAAGMTQQPTWIPYAWLLCGTVLTVVSEIVRKIQASLEDDAQKQRKNGK